MFSPRLAIFGSYKAEFRPISAETLTFDQPFQLGQEVSLVDSIYA